MTGNERCLCGEEGKEGLVKMPNFWMKTWEIQYEINKLQKSVDFCIITPLTNVRHRSIILVLFLTKQ